MGVCRGSQTLTELGRRLMFSLLPRCSLVTLCVLPLVQYQDQDSDHLGLVIVAVLVVTARLIKKLTVSPTYVVLIVCKNENFSVRLYITSCS